MDRFTIRCTKDPVPEENMPEKYPDNIRLILAKFRLLK
jgi:hypothetical protein